MVDRLKGKVAIITGAGGGIGRAHSLALASEGAKIVVNDLGGAADGTGKGTAPADKVVAEIKQKGGQAVANYDSVATEKGGQGIIKTAIDAFGKLDILVNNAGILRDKMIWNMTEEEWDLVMKVHLYGHFFTTKHACAYFRESKGGGRIINTSSTAGLGSTIGQPNYGAAKEGIIGFTRQVARVMERYGVTCNAIRPTAGTRLTLSDEMRKVTPKETIEKWEAQVPEDISPLIVWLASDAAANVNGRTFRVVTGEIGLYTEPVLEKKINATGPWTIDDLFKRMPTITSHLKSTFIPPSAA